MKDQINVFICDNCEKEIETDSGFPYDKGWIYLYKFSSKLSNDKFVTRGDKHFCSKECLIKSIEKDIK